MCQGLKRCAEPVLHAPRTIGDAPHLAVIAAEKYDDPISLSKRIGFQYDGVALMERHYQLSVNSLTYHAEPGQGYGLYSTRRS